VDGYFWTQAKTIAVAGAICATAATGRKFGGIGLSSGDALHDDANFKLERGTKHAGTMVMPKAQNYWNNRYASSERARASGTFVHSETANRWFYRAKSERIQEILRDSRIDLSNAAVLDAACGTGAFVPLWLSLGASRVVGLDISDKAVELCAQRFSETKACEFKRVDLSSNEPGKALGGFDFICIFEAIFLLTDEKDFVVALGNLCSWLKPGGHLLISDQFPEQTIPRHERLTYHARSVYERVFKQHNVQFIKIVRQTVLFNRHIFPEKIQSLVEAKCPWGIYFFNRLVLAASSNKSCYIDEAFYGLAQKHPSAPN
jgi:2-polyprenyl-3-methyl-5-hydroxy-6-metoxy-1,4-benzoquinol methylase